MDSDSGLHRGRRYQDHDQSSPRMGLHLWISMVELVEVLLREGSIPVRLSLELSSGLLYCTVVLDVVYWCQLRLDMVYVVSYELTRCGIVHATTAGGGTGSRADMPKV